MMARVRSVIRRRTDAGSRQNVAGSMSAKTGTAPYTIAAVADALIV
jgi:hypothetical protein